MEKRSHKITLAGTARGIQAAFTLNRDAAKAKEKPRKPRGRLPIGEAAAAGRLIEVEQLLDSGVNVNATDSYGETALHLACMEGQYTVVRMLVVEHQARMDIRNWEGWVPMIWAIVRGHVETVKFLAERGSSLQWKTNLNWTPLHFAAMLGQHDLVDWLLEEGCDALAVGEDGCMPGDCASNPRVRRTLYKTGKGKSAVREFLESHRMGYLLQHEDLHHTLEHLSPPLPGMKKTSLSMAVGRFKSRLTNAAASKAQQDAENPQAQPGSPGKLTGAAVQPAPPRKPSARLQFRSPTSVTGTWGPASGAKAVSLLSQAAVKNSSTCELASPSASAALKRSSEGAEGNTKPRKDSLKQGVTFGSTKIGAWNDDDGGLASVQQQPAESPANDTQGPLTMVSSASHAAEQNSTQWQRNSADEFSFSEGATSNAGFGEGFASAMGAVSSRHLDDDGNGIV